MAAATSTQTAVHRPRTLVSAWLFLSSFVVAWDIGYILLRPRSMLGGDLHWIWSPYALYMNVDYIYGLPSWDSKDGFPAAQSLMNVGESILNLFYIYLVHVKATPSSLAVAPIWGLTAVIMTLSKTILYVLNVSRRVPLMNVYGVGKLTLSLTRDDIRTTAADGARRGTTTGTRSSSTGSSLTVFGSFSPPSSLSCSFKNSLRHSRSRLEYKVRSNRLLCSPSSPPTRLVKRQVKRRQKWALIRTWFIIRSSRAGHRTTRGSSRATVAPEEHTQRKG